MKTIKWLSLALMLMGTTQGYTLATTDDALFELKSISRTSGSSHKSKHDKKNDTRNTHQQRFNSSKEGEADLQVERGPKGDKGDPGESPSIVYAHYYKLTNDDVASKTAVIFDTVGADAGELKYEASNGAVIIPEDGDYLVSYFVDTLSDNGVVLGVELNDTIIPGSIYRTSTSVQPIQLQGSTIVKANTGDTLKLINLSNEDMHFDNSALSHVNASLLIKKLN